VFSTLQVRRMFHVEQFKFSKRNHSFRRGFVGAEKCSTWNIIRKNGLTEIQSAEFYFAKAELELATANQGQAERSSQF
jgi:hypothetical protein